MDSVAALLSLESPHIVALQEADSLSFWNGSFDHVKYIAETSGYPCYLHGEHMDRLRLKYGTALLSQGMLSDPLSIGFRTSKPLPRKGFVVAESHWPGRPEICFDVVSVHLDFLRPRLRLKEIDRLVEVLEERGRPMIIMGDLNCEWAETFSAVRTICERLQLHSFEPRSSSLVTFPIRRKRWDWILASDLFQFDSYSVLSANISDHRAVVSELRLRKDRCEER